MTNITNEIHIDSSKDHIWEILADIGGIEKYSPSVKKSYSTSDINSGEDATRHCDLIPLGTTEERVQEWRDNEGYTIEIIGGSKLPPVKNMSVNFSVHSNGEESTKVTAVAHYDTKFSFIGSLLNRLVIKSQFEKIFKGILVGLKHHVETGEYVTRDVLKKANLA